MTELWGALIAVAVGLVVVWIALLIALAVTRPKDLSISDALRLLPDAVVLLRRLAADPQLPRGVRIRLLLLLGYLILPFDLVPDFIPVLGYADDAIIVAAALRSVARRAGPGALEKHWPGTPEGLHAVRRLAGIPTPPET
ncbi:MAG: hypothetical protein QOE74_5719 [Mycobacterium sp.]|jgi:uncharacterized membrane protein YkvA (DUF1232 family)|nr:hypothetical protein [Mycobacterium sp.]